MPDIDALKVLVREAYGTNGFMKITQDTTGQDRTGQDRTGQNRTGQDRTGQDRKGEDTTRL